MIIFCLFNYKNTPDFLFYKITNKFFDILYKLYLKL